MSILSAPSGLRRRLRLFTIGLQNSNILPWLIRRWMLGAVGVKFHPQSFIEPTATIYSGDLEVGSGTYINNFFLLDGLGGCSIGTNVRIGPSVKLLTASHEITHVRSARASYDVSNRPIKIEDGVWLGAGVTVLAGCIVRTGCVVGAHALITTSTEPDGLYLGVPARRVRDLPTD